MVSLDEALDRSGVTDSSAFADSNPRLIGPRAETEAAQALIGQARLRPNPQVSLEAEDFAGSGAFSGLRATQITLSVGQQLELLVWGKLRHVLHGEPKPCECLVCPFGTL